MKKVLAVMAITMLVVGSASAMPISLNPDAVSTLSGFGTTGVFDQLGILAQTTSSVTGPGTFGDVGNMKVTSLIDIPTTAYAGMNGSWWLAGGWSDVAGTFAPDVDGGMDFTYISGTLKLYALSVFPDFNTWQVGANDDVGFIGDASNWVATLNLVSGEGLLDEVDGKDSGTTEITWEFDSILTGFWLDKDGDIISLADLNVGEKLFAFSDMNTSHVIIDELVIYSDHNGSVEIGVVPEPATMVLFGTGLLGMIGAARRKKRA